MAKDYEPHEYAKLFPLSEGKPLAELAEDIKANGLLEPIMIFQGKILDGRRRELACIRAEVQPKFAKFKGTEGEALAWVISKNLHRRHLDESQRAMVAAKVATLEKGRPITASNEAVNQKSNAPIGAFTQSQAAESLNVSTRAVQRAKTVHANGTPALVQAVEAGDVSVSDAAAIAKESPEVQEAAVEAVANGHAKTLAAAVNGKHEKNGKAEAKEVDPLGHAIPAKCRDAFANLERFKVLDSLAQQLQKQIDDLSRLPGGEQLCRCLKPTGNDQKTINKSEHLNSLKRDLKGTRPHSVCPWCKGTGTSNCKGCSGNGWVTKLSYDNAPETLTAELA